MSDTPSNALSPQHRLLRQALVAMQFGDMEDSQSFAKSALWQAQRQGDGCAQARALLYLAQGDLQMSRMRRARETARRAAYLFQTEGDLVGEAEALATLSHGLSFMGQSTEAVETAFWSLRLCEGIEPLGEAMARSVLGLAFACGQHFDKAQDVLRQSVASLESAGLWAASCVPRFHMRAAELYRCFLERYQSGTWATLDRLRDLHGAPLHVRADADTLHAMVWPHPKTMALLDLTLAMESCWRGDFDDAVRRADAVYTSVEKGVEQPLVRLMEVWLRAEIAWAKQDWPIAEMQGQRLQQLAIRSENEHFRSISYLLLAQIMGAQNKQAHRNTQLRLMNMQETHLRDESLHSRKDRVEWQRRARTQGEEHPLSSIVARRAGQPAWNDALTGLCNRDHLEQVLPEVLDRGAERRLTPALAYVGLSPMLHAGQRLPDGVGDAILKAIAHILSRFVRQGDVAVRLGATQFAVLFPHVDAHAVAGLLARIHKAVNHVEWGKLHAGLELTATCGMALAEAGDTLESWLGRCLRSQAAFAAGSDTAPGGGQAQALAV